MIAKSVAGFVAAAVIAATAAVAGAAGPGGGGGGGGIGAGGIGGIGNIGAFGMNMGAIGANHIAGIPHGISKGGGGAPGVMSGSMSNSLPQLPTNEPEHYHEIKLVGNVAPDELGLTIDAQVVRLRVNDRTIPMTINSGVVSEALQFDQGDEQGQMLFRTIMSKRLVVVGEEGLRDKITRAASANRENSKPLIVDGYVYDRATPYLVLRSVDDAP